MLGFAGFLLNDLKWRLKHLRSIYEVMQKGPGIEIRQGTTIINPAALHTSGDLRIEADCFFHCGGNAWSGGQGYIKVGKGCWFAQKNVLYGAGGIEIGDHSGTGPGVMIFSSRDNYDLEHARKPHIVHTFGKVTIGSYVRIFSGAIVSPGVTIGEGAVIGANSVVLSDIPPWTIAAGTPAKPLRARERDSVEVRKPRGPEPS
jgi:acetyltransferase-like isoleucine patch superfamily enzyme